MRAVLLMLVGATAGWASGCVSPTGPNTITPASSGVFSGTVYPDGRTQWPFELTATGTVRVTLTSVDPSSLVLGVGIGEFSGHRCELASQAETKASNAPQLTSLVDAGEKCVAVFDVGGVPSSGASFSLTIQGP